MKKTIMGLFMLGLVVPSYAQEMLYEAKLKKEEVPEVIIEAVGVDFPGFVMEEYTAVPLEYMADDVIINKDIKSNDDYNTYQIRLLGKKDDEIVATYDKDGTLLNSLEHLKNIAPPTEVRDAVAKAYPGWAFAKDSFRMVHYNGDKKMERYRIVLEKGNKRKRVYTNAKGKILDHRGKKHHQKM